MLGGRVVQRLVRRHRLLPSARALVVGDGPEAEPTCRALLESGADVAWAGEGAGPDLPGLRRLPGHRVRAARGGARVRAIELQGPDGHMPFRAGLVAVCGPRAAAFELGAQAGLPVEPRGSRGFVLRAGEDGATALPWLWAAGSCTSAGVGSDVHGARAGRAAA